MQKMATFSTYYFVCTFDYNKGNVKQDSSEKPLITISEYNISKAEKNQNTSGFLWNFQPVKNRVSRNNGETCFKFENAKFSKKRA